MAVTIQERTKPEVSPTMLWAGVLLGPVAWALDEGLSYALEQHSCSTGHFYVLHVISVVCFALAGLGVVIARAQLSKLGPGDENGGSSHDRSWWMARLGVGLGIGSALVIIAIAIPKLLLSPCD